MFNSTSGDSTATAPGSTVSETDAKLINHFVKRTHHANRRWWLDISRDPPTPLPPSAINVGEKLMLVVSEISEAMEGHRKSLPDDKLPHRSMLEVELADAVIRIFDLAGGLGLDLGGAFAEKMAYNARRQDHTIEARRAENRKKY